MVSFNRAWIPAVAGILLFIGCDKKEAGTAAKPAANIPTTAPAAIKEPHQILAHLQYAGVRKDLKHVAILEPKDATADEGAANWFHRHAGDASLALNDEEIKAFGMEEAKKRGLVSTIARNDFQKKLDELSAAAASQPAPKGKKAAAGPALPPELANLDMKVLDLPQDMDKMEWEKVIQPFLKANLSAFYQSGLWRLIKGVPAELWGEIEVMETRNNPTDAKLKHVFLGMGGKPVIELTLQQNPDQSYGLVYWLYKVSPKTLQKAADKLKAGAAAPQK